MTLGLAKLKVDTIGDIHAIKKANGLLDALAYRLTKVSHAITGKWKKRSRHSVTPR